MCLVRDLLPGLAGWARSEPACYGHCYPLRPAVASGPDNPDALAEFVDEYDPLPAHCHETSGPSKSGWETRL